MTEFRELEVGDYYTLPGFAGLYQVVTFGHVLLQLDTETGIAIVQSRKTLVERCEDEVK